MSKKVQDTVLVSAFFDKNKKGVLLVGKKDPKTREAEVVNAFQDEEAWELYQKIFFKKDAKK